MIDKCARNIDTLTDHIKMLKASNSQRIQEEYDKLVENLKRAELERSEEYAYASPVLPEAILQESIPGSIRTAEHFMVFMRYTLKLLFVTAIK